MSNQQAIYRPVLGPYHQALAQAHRERLMRFRRKVMKKEAPACEPPQESDIYQPRPAVSPPERPSFGLSPPRHVVVQRIVAEAFGVDRAELIGPRRGKTIVGPRMIAMFILRHVMGTKVSLPQIGRVFGGRDHTTVLHALRSVERRMEGDAAFRMLVERLLVQASCGRKDDNEDTRGIGGQGATAANRGGGGSA